LFFNKIALCHIKLNSYLCTPKKIGVFFDGFDKVIEGFSIEIAEY